MFKIFIAEKLFSETKVRKIFKKIDEKVIQYDIKERFIKGSMRKFYFARKS